MKVKLLIITVLAAVALSAGWVVGQHTRHEAPWYGTWLDVPRPVTAFSLMGTNDKPFDNQSLKGHWTFLFFGFTSCPSLCPTTMGKFSRLYALLESKKMKTMPEIVLISLDPARDSLDKLKHYVEAFNPHFLGARGESEEAVKPLTTQMGVAYLRVVSKGMDAQNYTIDHTGTVMLINPEGELAAFFTTPEPAEMAADYERRI